jgi:hypothetical protein
MQLCDDGYAFVARREDSTERAFIFLTGGVQIALLDGPLNASILQACRH